MKNLSNRTGRPKKIIFNKQSTEETLKLIFYYHDNYNPHSQIRYKDIWEHFEELFNNGNYEYKTSYDFWKRSGREGRELVDKVNDHLKTKSLVSIANNIDMINFKEIIEKYGAHNKDILWENLKPYEKHIIQLSNSVEKIKNENENMIKQNNELKVQLNESKEMVGNLQQLIFSLFVYSNKDNELYNLLNTGKSKSKVIDLALEKTFESPLAFINEMLSKSFIPSDSLKDSLTTNNVYEFTPKSKPEKEYDL